MTQIGSFNRTASGYEGRLRTLTLDIGLYLTPAVKSDADKAPDWRIHSDDPLLGPEVGAGWDHVGDKAGSYVSLVIDCPGLPQTIEANLFLQAGGNGVHRLIWSRAQGRRERA